MQNINNYISEKLRISPKRSKIEYKFFPQDKKELREEVLTIIREEGNNCDLSCIDVSKVTDMHLLFANEKFNNLNCDVTGWNMANVKCASGMFENCEKFEGRGLETWDVSNMQNCSGMFYKCKNLDADLSRWELKNLERATSMFNECVKFNCDLSYWGDVFAKSKKLSNISAMFNGCKNFEAEKLENWEKFVFDVEDVSWLFSGCKSLPNWYK